MTHATRPRVGVSACLLGERVRYDGGDKHAPDLVAALAGVCDLVPVCPEVELGMGIPREPVHLAGDAAAPRMLGNESRRDWTEPMRTWARARARELLAEGLAGFVLKARSPSCGPADIPVLGPGGETLAGRGLFAAALLAACPDLPVADERALADAASIARFVAAVRRRHAAVQRA